MTTVTKKHCFSWILKKCLSLLLIKYKITRYFSFVCTYLSEAREWQHMTASMTAWNSSNDSIQQHQWQHWMHRNLRRFRHTHYILTAWESALVGLLLIKCKVTRYFSLVCQKEVMPYSSFTQLVPLRSPQAPPRHNNIDILTTTFNYFETFLFVSSSSSLSLLTFSCVPILNTQWLSSPHILVQHGESHDTLQWLKQLNGFVIVVKLLSLNPIIYNGLTHYY